MTGWTLDYALTLDLDSVHLILEVDKRERAARRLESMQTADFPHLKKPDRVKIVDRLKHEAAPKDRPAMTLDDFVRARMRKDGGDGR